MRNAASPSRGLEDRTATAPGVRERRGFTLIEALIATAILSMSVLALSAAVGAGQKSSIEGQKVVLASMATADLLSELSSVAYTDLKTYDGKNESPGAMKTLDGGAYPGSYWMVGRTVSVTDQSITDAGLSVTIKGLRIVVTATDGSRTLMSAEAFVPEPGS